MSSSVYSSHGSSGTFNPYRHGVLIGNYVEDTFGRDLREKYIKQSKTPTNKNSIPISEFTDKYRYPKITKEMLMNPGNELTMTCTSNFDLDIDFTRKNVKDFMGLAKKNKYVLDNKNNFLPTEVQCEYLTKQYENEKNNITPQDNVYDQTQKTLKKFHMKDTMGILYSRKNGLLGNLLFGHGCQSKFKTNEYASTYHLAMNKHIPTETFYNSKYRVNTPFMHQPNPVVDNGDWGFRKFKTYGQCTKKFDKKKDE